MIIDCTNRTFRFDQPTDMLYAYSVIAEYFGQEHTLDDDYPVHAITTEDYELINGWIIEDVYNVKGITRLAFRDIQGNITAEYRGLSALGRVGTIKVKKREPHFNEDLFIL